MLNSIPNIINNNLILGGDFNFFFDNLNSNWKSYLWRKKKSKKKVFGKTYWDQGSFGLMQFTESKELFIDTF